MRIATVLSASVITLGLAASAIGPLSAEQAAPAKAAAPQFKYDKTFPKPFPNN